MTAHLHGRVIDAHTRHGLADCVVTASGDKGPIETVDTIATGRFAFTFEAKAEGWNYSLRCEREGYHPTTVDGVTAGDHEIAMEAVHG